MRNLLFIILIILLVIPVVQAYKNNIKYYQLPFIVAIATLGFIVPTLYSVKDNLILSDQEYFLYLLNAILCLTASYVGYSYKVKKPKLKKNYYDYRTIILVLTPLTLIGFYISFFLIDASELGLNNSGPIAIFLYFGRFLRPLAVILFFLWLMFKRKYVLLLFSLYLIVSLNFIIISGRRSEVFTLAIIILLPLFFVRNYIPSKKIILLIFAFGISSFFILPAIRGETRQGNFNEISNVSLQSLASAYYSGNKTNEVIEAAVNMRIIYENNGYSYGARFINKFTHQYFSSVLFGENLKKSVTISTFDTKKARDNSVMNSYYKSYLTLTGFADTFYDFGFFSFLVFYFFARLSKYIWVAAYYSNDIMIKMFYSYFVIMIFLSVYDSISFIPTTILQGILIFYLIVKTSKINKYV